ncbi:hypothetical protein CYMTET_17113 [Cymbomonas tetramitiformis]|uniref:Uncharacterized protein n=1 Tax=Cymbomonas tetramitiformis TaxID=36881 RepID=A0AAE0GC49_9CHLO|nr:hypothetical protein CYMTET_17113 [Cymbomonas tetramitiformis]
MVERDSTFIARCHLPGCKESPSRHKAANNDKEAKRARIFAAVAKEKALAGHHKQAVELWITALTRLETLEWRERSKVQPAWKFGLAEALSAKGDLTQAVKAVSDLLAVCNTATVVDILYEEADRLLRASSDHSPPPLTVSDASSTPLEELDGQVVATASWKAVGVVQDESGGTCESIKVIEDIGCVVLWVRGDIILWDFVRDKIRHRIVISPQLIKDKHYQDVLLDSWKSGKDTWNLVLATKDPDRRTQGLYVLHDLESLDISAEYYRGIASFDKRVDAEV